MKTIIQYTDQADRETKLQENQDKFLIEEQNIQDGNFLIFSDVKSTDEQLKQLQQDTLILMDALTSAFEEILALKEQIQGGVA